MLWTLESWILPSWCFPPLIVKSHRYYIITFEPLGHQILSICYLAMSFAVMRPPWLYIQTVWLTQFCCGRLWSSKEFQECRCHPVKVHIFWEGHKILRSLHLSFDLHYIEKSKVEISQILWPSQNIWTLITLKKIP